MKPITLIETALIVGESAISRGALSQSAADTFQALKQRILHHFGGDAEAEQIFADFEREPDTYRMLLRKTLHLAQVDHDEETLKYAGELMTAADPEGSIYIWSSEGVDAIVNADVCCGEPADSDSLAGHSTTLPLGSVSMTMDAESNEDVGDSSADFGATAVVQSDSLAGHPTTLPP